MPEVKPGVVPLRPLGLGDLLEGAIATLRQNPAATLGLSAAVATASACLQVGVQWLLLRDVTRIERAESATEALRGLTDSLTGLVLVLIVGYLATTVLTGMLTVVVSRAVLGQRVRAGAAWRAALPQLPRLLGLSLLVTLALSLPFVLLMLPGVLVAAAGEGAAGVTLAVLGALLALPVAAWLWVRLALATPALMLETSSGGSSGTLSGPGSRRTGVREALRRSWTLVGGAWWRTFGVLLLIGILGAVLAGVLFTPFAVVGSALEAAGVLEPTSLPRLLLDALGGVLVTTLAAPFTAAVTVLLYVDRRISREGLDIELARAAGVTIPGRSDVAGRPAPAGRSEHPGPA